MIAWPEITNASASNQVVSRMPPGHRRDTTLTPGRHRDTTGTPQGQHRYTAGTLPGRRPQRLRSQAAGGGSTSTIVPTPEGHLQDAIAPFQKTPSPTAVAEQEVGVCQWWAGIKAVCLTIQKLAPKEESPHDASPPLQAVLQQIRRSGFQAGRPGQGWEVVLMQRPSG